MELKLKNKVAFVGGSSKGIGKGIAFQLAKEGVNLIICARNGEVLEQVAEEIRIKYEVKVLAIATDLSNISEIKTIIQQSIDYFGRIDILVVNSGGPKPGRFFDLEDKDWALAYNSVLLYVVELYKQIIPIMKSNRWGRIINIASLSVKEPSEALLLSNVFRAGVVSLAKSISSELYEHGITINNICPGAFRTDRAIELMQNKAIIKGKTIEQIEKEVTASLPGNRFSPVEEIGYLVTFLSSELAQDVTGTTIQIDKGMSKGLF